MPLWLPDLGFGGAVSWDRNVVAFTLDLNDSEYSTVDSEMRYISRLSVAEFKADSGFLGNIGGSLDHGYEDCEDIAEEADSDTEGIQSDFIF